MNKNHTGNQISSIAISNTIFFCNKEYHQKNDLQGTTKIRKTSPTYTEYRFGHLVWMEF
jgi:hypothetical protein